MENKKKVIILGVLGGLGILGGFGLWAVKKKTPLINPTPLVSPTPVAAEKRAIYEDEAGFSFEYPESLTIKDISGEEDYSVLKITSPAQTGQMIIKVVDTSEKEVGSNGDSRDITLADLPAKQFQLENPRRLVTAAVDKGVLFHLESPLETTGTYWNKIHNDIVASFTLSEQKKTSTDTIYEEEEIVE